MEHWTTDILAAIAAAFIIGVIVGTIAIRILNGNVKKQHDLEKELKQTKTQVDEQKQKLEQHFEQSAQLLSTLAADYKKLYTHLAESSGKLLPENAKQIDFFQQSQISLQPQASDENQPRDYSEGSSGLLKS